MATRAAWIAMVAKSAPVPVKVGSVQPTGTTVPMGSGGGRWEREGVVAPVVEHAPPAVRSPGCEGGDEAAVAAGGGRGVQEGPAAGVSEPQARHDDSP